MAMIHALDANESLEILRRKLRTMVRDDAWPGLGKGFQRPLYDNLHILPGHRRADFVMHDGAAVAIEKAAQIIEGAGKIQSGHVDVPMRMG